MTRQFWLSLSVLALLLWLPTVVFAAITAGQVDTFEGLGATAPFAGWTDGHGGNNVANPTGGPAGGSDHYLQISSGSFDTQSRLISFNQSQWIGNYTAAGVSLIEMDLQNFGSSTLSMRIAIRQSTGPSFIPGYATASPYSLPVDGQWHQAVFFTLSTSDASALQAVNSPNALATDLASVADFRLLSAAVGSPNPLLGDSISGQVGVDNIRALPGFVPGDFNFDRTVNNADLQAMLDSLKNVNSFATSHHLDGTNLLSIGDLNHDNVFNAGDIASMQTLLAGGGGGGGVSPVPEPATVGLALLGLGSLLTLGRQKVWRS